ncbi:VOC family protein [Nocardioides ferulae]|uniref:VOC family protein n=1 Tax=Nocardioides ferulae TaxID=2340821 RepID=UPI000EADB587|nr:VOC family protein [Nocardioides ferulae]
MTPSWVSAFLDFAPDEFAAGVEHWRRVTGYGLSTTRGEDGEFASLLPPDGDDYLRVQRLGQGPSRIHLDLHVADADEALESAVGHGASLVARPLGDDGYAVLTSPGGFPFCLVTHRASIRPRPAPWGDGAWESVVDQVCLDIPPAAHEREVAFWAAVTGWEARPTSDEFTNLVRPGTSPLRLLLQRLDQPESGPVTAHLDLSSTDRDAETARHVALGARVLERFEHWTVLAAPAGPAYCITARTPDPMDPEACS